MSNFRRRREDDFDHRDWLALVETSGPFLSVPVLRATWPALDSLDKQTRDDLRGAHLRWQADIRSGKRAWLDYILRDLLGWQDALHTEGLAALSTEVAEHDTTLTADFALIEPGAAASADSARLLGMVLEPGTQPTSRVRDSAWAATPVDRMAVLCRKVGVELGLVTDGRWWALVWAPLGGATATAVFDAVLWPEAAERDVVRAFMSLLCRRRFFAVPDEELLVALLRKSGDNQEDITDRLGVQVRQAVELLVAAIGRAEIRSGVEGEPPSAHEVYRASVAVMMRIVFILFAEEKGLLPADNELYARSYSAGRLHDELADRARNTSEDLLEHTYTGWHRLLALFAAVYSGIDHPRLTMHPHDGSIFDPNSYAVLPLAVDDRTVLHMLRAVQSVELGTGRNKERRTVSFRELDVEQIGYVYEGLLSFDALRADEVVLGFIGKAGVEAEVALSELEAAAAEAGDLPTLAAGLADSFKSTGIGSARALVKALAPVSGREQEERRKKLLAVNGKDHTLAERLLPFYKLIRSDLRDMPTVILPGALYVTDSALRKNTGTHYTPRELAEEVVEGALQPLVYTVGPLQTADEKQWKPKSNAELLELKVADIAMGSAAFLVAAARYLGDRLVEAWVREGDERVREYRASDHVLDPDQDPVRIDARRQVIEHCLYGADINEMAVEMAKLSLWLVSMDPEKPFTFLDDRLVVGDSLLGITSLEQLEYMHMDPARGRKLHADLFEWTSGVRELVASVADERKRITEIGPGLDPVAALARKRSLLADVKLQTGQLHLFADLAVGAALAHASRGGRSLDSGSITASKYTNRVASGDGEKGAREVAQEWLSTDHVDGLFRRRPIHWPLEFPEAFKHAGFDAIIGNPPFLGGAKLKTVMGEAYRDHIVDTIGNGVRGVRGTADLVAYFTLRAHSLANQGGQIGLIATNTLAQGDSREVGLSQILADGSEIRRAIKSEPWPSKSASLEYCAVWLSRAPLAPDSERVLNQHPVARINESLDDVSQSTWTPQRLRASQNLAFKGSFVFGLGFVIDDDTASRLTKLRASNREVIFPYLNGEDLNNSPDYSARRQIVNFFDRTLDEANQYPECLDLVRKLVKPQRDGDPIKSYERYWWRFGAHRPTLYRAIRDLDKVIALAQTSRTAIPALVPTGQVFDQKVVVFASNNPGLLAILTSAIHYWWARSRCSTMKTDLSYTPTAAFETLVLPEYGLEDLGHFLDNFRSDVMRDRGLGLTKIYNLVFNPACQDTDIVELRGVHRMIDEAAVSAYGWEDLIDHLDHDFHAAGRETRYTIGPVAQREILDRLLELNRERYEAELKAGVHNKPTKKRKDVVESQAMFDV